MKVNLRLSPDFRTAFLRDMAMTAEAVERAFNHQTSVRYPVLTTLLSAD